MADVILAIIPMTFLRKLEMSRGRRVYLSVLLGLGSMLVNIRLFLSFLNSEFCGCISDLSSYFPGLQFAESSRLQNSLRLEVMTAILPVSNFGLSCYMAIISIIRLTGYNNLRARIWAHALEFV